MASIILSQAVGSFTRATGIFRGLGPLAPLARGLVNKQTNALGKFLDTSIFGYDDTFKNVQGPRLSSLAVQASTYGDTIPRLYGTMRIAGNIIWSRPIKETATTTTTTSTAGGKGGGTPRTVRSETNYSYSVTLAIALCEGAIDDIVRVWADTKLIDPSRFTSSYALYKGDESQLPDPTIESFEGIGNVPAYRGMAYVVIEDFPLEDYGNRIPNFTFEVKKKALAIGDEIPLEEKITAITMIPGSGEFVYDTVVQKKVVGEDVGSNFEETDIRTRINQTNHLEKANALVSLDQLERDLPNVEWVSVVVTWFGDSLDAGTCLIRPGVEYQTGATTTPDTWSVAGLNRASAYPITLVDGSPRYGGTPSDSSVLHYLDELRDRGYKILFYPMFFMDVEDKPWRGRVTGSTTDVADFFTKTNGYNAFIQHYANLVDGKVDGFVIGSELIGLTKVKDGSNVFPAVSALVSLAATVKTILGSGVKITYAADWSEYHHTDDGWYNLDPLWASANIDVIGIDAYFPLTDEPQSGITRQKIMDGWTSGEGYSFYYTDDTRTTQASLSAPYAWKNIDWWWSNTHTNPDATTTAWVPESKKIWFTEFGFPSVDGCSNQPNVFYDPNSIESYFPRFSRGRVDFSAQRTALEATQDVWEGSDMVERMFVWTWDARPFPFWPDLTDVWADGPLWRTGHWINGKLGLSNLAAIVADLCRASGLSPINFDTTQLTDLVFGYMVPEQMTARESILQLAKAYFFDAVERDGKLIFCKRGKAEEVELALEDIVIEKSGNEPLSIERTREISIAQVVDVTYFSQASTYQVGDQHARRRAGLSDEKITINLPIVLSDSEAKTIAETTLYESWLSRNRFTFSVPLQKAWLEPCDRVVLNVNGAIHTMRVQQVDYEQDAFLKVTAIAEDTSSYDFYSNPFEGNLTETLIQSGQTSVQLLDIPAAPTDSVDVANLRVAMRGEENGWHGGVLYRSDDGSSYSPLLSNNSAAMQGVAIDALADGITQRMDEASSVTILLNNTEGLATISQAAVLNGGNAALLGDEIIQFRNAEFLGDNRYKLSGLMRGRQGTEYAISSHAIGERFILLDNRVNSLPVSQSLFNISRAYKAVSIGETLPNTDAFTFIYTAKALKPFSPVHISGTRDGSSNLTIKWVRRARIHGSWQDNVDVPLDESSEIYHIEILNGSLVVRTFETTVPVVIYTSVQQVTDFGAAQPSITCKIYQLSSLVGRGCPLTANV